MLPKHTFRQRRLCPSLRDPKLEHYPYSTPIETLTDRFKELSNLKPRTEISSRPKPEPLQAPSFWCAKHVPGFKYRGSPFASFCGIEIRDSIKKMITTRHQTSNSADSSKSLPGSLSKREPHTRNPKNPQALGKPHLNPPKNLTVSRTCMNNDNKET